MNKLNNGSQCIPWEDSEQTGAKGWLVIDSLISEVASGGIFMHAGATLKETQDLAATMTLKNSLQQPIIGGAKGGICFDHNHPDAKEVLKRFLIAKKHYIENHWNTGSDLNTDNAYIQDIIQNELGLSCGFTSLAKMLTQKHQLPNLEKSFNNNIKLPASKYFNLSKSATGFSIATCIAKLCSRNCNLFVQGLGTVGKSLIYYIETLKLGNVVGVMEKKFFIYGNYNNCLMFNLLIDNQGDIAQLFRKAESLGLKIYKRDERLSDNEFLINCLLKQKADIFSPCAARYIVTNEVMDVLHQFTLKDSRSPWIVSGANNIFENDTVLEKLINLKMGFLPEWVSNSGNSLLYNEILKYSGSIIELPKNILHVIKSRINNFLNECLNYPNGDFDSLYYVCNKIANQRIGSVANKS